MEYGELTEEELLLEKLEEEKWQWQIRQPKDKDIHFQDQKCGCIYYVVEEFMLDSETLPYYANEAEEVVKWLKDKTELSFQDLLSKLSQAQLDSIICYFGALLGNYYGYRDSKPLTEVYLILNKYNGTEPYPYGALLKKGQKKISYSEMTQKKNKRKKIK